jgi:predicted dehydrogenase
MGISHLAILRSHPDLDVVGVCDTAGYVLDVLEKYAGLRTFSDYRELLALPGLDAIVIATPSKLHGTMTREALERGLHCFVEKPFCLDADEGQRLADLAEQKGLVTQVGYHYRFVGAFMEMKRLLALNAIGDVSHFRVEAYGPVVVRPSPASWRNTKSEGGGCLYDYASHAVDLIGYLMGTPDRVQGASLGKVFSQDVEDEVYAMFHYANGRTGHLATNWSDESQRKMSMRFSVWGSEGRLYADRQECRLYRKHDAPALGGINRGWTVRYTTELTHPVWYYLRGEEYSAQVDEFANSMTAGRANPLYSLQSASATDRVIGMIRANASDAADGGPVRSAATPRPGRARRRDRVYAIVDRLIDLSRGARG